MSKYVENNLQSGEEIIVRARINKLAAMAKIVFALVVLITLIVLQIMVSIKADNEKIAALSASELDQLTRMGVKGLGWYTIAKFMWIFWLFGVIIAVVPMVIDIIRLFFTDIAATNRRVIGKTGVVATKTVDIIIGKVDTVKIETTFWGRVFKFYTLEISGGGNANGVKFKGVVNANEIRNEINNAVERYAEDQRKAQAAEIASAMNGSRNDGN